MALATRIAVIVADVVALWVTWGVTSHAVKARKLLASKTSLSEVVLRYGEHAFHINGYM